MDCVNRDRRGIWITEDEVHHRTGWRRIVLDATTLTHKQLRPKRERLEEDDTEDGMNVW